MHKRFNKGRFLFVIGLFFLNTVLFTQCRKKQEEEKPQIIEEHEELSGGDATTFDASLNAFGNFAPNLGEEDKFVVGNSFFRNNWVIAPSSTTARDGIGPLFNSYSCSGCHSDDGRGKPPLSATEDLSSMIIRLSLPGTGIHGAPIPVPNYGDQLSNKAIPGVIIEGKVQVTYTEEAGYYDDGTQYSLRVPHYTFYNLGYGAMPANFLFSPRVAPQLPGLGLLEAVDEGTILSFADPSDANGDGISGKPNYVWDAKQQKNVMGRFGWKANQPSVRQQTAAAFQGDMGITSGLFPEDNFNGTQVSLYDTLPNGGNPEISGETFENVAYYSATLAVPARRNWKEPQVLLGKQVFTEAQCSSCHIPSMKTGANATIAGFSNQKIRPYTDLLLHNMGAGLADGRPDFLANGQEWRTPPLWGIGLLKTVNGHTFLLHDGRARNFEEAILWHGGEAEKAKNYFKKLKKEDRDALIKFLQSL